MPRPNLPPTQVEIALKFIGYLTIVIGGLTGIAVAFLYASAGDSSSGALPLAGLGLLLGVLIFGGAIATGVWALAAAEGLAYLRLAEQRQLIAEWDARHPGRPSAAVEERPRRPPRASF